MADEAELSPTDFWLGQLRYHRGMAIARAGTSEVCTEHTAKAFEALEKLREIALANAPVSQ